MKQRIFYEEFESFYYYSGSTQNWDMQGYHVHKDYEVILFMCDDAVISIGNRVYTVETGDLFLINNREYHKTSGLEGKEYKRYVLMFDPDSIKEAGEAMGYPFTLYFEEHPDNFIHKLNLSGTNLSNVIDLFQKIEACSHHKDQAAHMVRLKLAIMELLVSINMLYDFFSSETPHISRIDSLPDEHNMIRDRERVELIKKYIMDHIEDRLDLDDIAGKFYISRYYLSHYFKKETGFTLSQYITNHKIAAAKTMLVKGFSVTEVAVALSYNSDSHFINTFKKMTGTTPKKYSVENQK